MDNTGIFLDPSTLRKNASFLRTTPMLYMCRNIIQQQLFCNGVVFSHRRGRVRPDPHMQEIMSDYWLPFCKDMVDSIFSVGIVVVRLVAMEDGLCIPVVIEPGACRIKMVYNYGIREYIAVDDQQQQIPDTMVLDGFGHAPTQNGQLTSVVSNLLPEITFNNMMRGTALVMEQKRADPEVVTEAVDTKTDNVEGVNYDYYADGDMQDASDNNRFNRNRSNVLQLQHQQAMYDNFFSGGAPMSKGGDLLEKVVTLPLGQRIVNMPHTTGRGDLVAQNKSFQDLVCGVMGVPRSLLMSDTPHKSDEAGTHQTFHKTIMWWKNKLQHSCERIYNIIYAEDIKSQLMNAMGKKRKRDANIMDVYSLKKRLQVEIIFPISPFLSSEGLHAHYQRGVIPWDTYVEHACANASLPHQPMPEPCSRDMTDTPDEAEAEKKSNSKDKEKEKEDAKEKDAAKETKKKNTTEENEKN